MKRLLLIVMLCISTLRMWAVPAKRVAIEVKQPDGTVLTLTYGGDEYFSYLLTEDGAMVRRVGDAYYYLHIEGGEVKPSKQLVHNCALRTAEEVQFVEALPSSSEMIDVALARGARAQQRRGAQAQQRAGEVPNQGEVRVPVLLVEFADKKFAADDPKVAFEGHINGDDYNAEGGYGSVKEYFEDQSEGKFVPKFDIIGPLTLSKNMEYYGGNDKAGSDKNPQAMVAEACKLAYNQEKVDFSQYDNNDDSYVDIIYIIYAGYGEASYPDKLEDTVWPHQWALAEPLQLGKVNVFKYACNNELDGYSGTTMDGIGTFCHEFSHCLGLPDFYPTNNSNAFGMFVWSLMHYGCYNNDGHTPCGYTGYEKDFLGWKKLVEINSATTVSLIAMSEGGEAYKIVNDANPNEYYIVENHQRSKWDKYAAAEGMLVLHVDYKESSWYNNVVNNDAAHQRMTIIPADNKLTNSTTSGDTYPGTSKNTELTSVSKPAATVYKGEFMNKDITDISMSDGVVTFSFMKGSLPVPVLGEAYDVTSSGFSVAWESVSDVTEYEVSLDVLEENPYMLEEDFNKVKKSNTDIGGSLDDYTIEPGWEGQGVYGLDGAIRLGAEESRGMLLSPYLKTDSACFTMLFTVKKSVPTDPTAGLVLGVIDDEWIDASGNYQLYGFIHLAEETEWTTYYAVINKVGRRSCLYMDTRDYSETAEKEGTRVDIDKLYLFEGDISDELKSNAPQRVGQSAASMRVGQHVDIAGLVAKHGAVPMKAPSQDGKKYKSTNIFTARTTDLSYRFDNLEGGLYRVTVRSVKDGVYSRPSNAVDVEIDDSMLPKIELVLNVELDNNIATIMVDDPEVTLYYTLDGTSPTSYGLFYEAPFELKEKATMLIMGRKPGYSRSEIYQYDNWFEVDGATYRIESTITPKVHLTAAMGGNNSTSYAGHVVVNDVVEYDAVKYDVISIEDGAFSNATALRSITMNGKGLQSVGEGLFNGCYNLNAVVWDIDLPLTGDAFDTSGYHNLLLYLPAGMTMEHPLMEKNNITLIQEYQCGRLKLNAQYPFYAPRAFTAEEVTLTRTFSQTTGLGTSAGWETIVLPFDVQSISHSGKGDIVPFGAEGEKHFWLAQLGGEGFAWAESMRANVPYLIAMPNHTDYGNNTLNGQITFSAKNATIAVSDELAPQKGDGFSLVPTYEKVAPNKDVYALNVVVKHGKADPGSVFVPGTYTVTPFSAYLVPATDAQPAPLYRIHVDEAMEENIAVEYSLMVQHGNVIITLPEKRNIEVYDMTGRLVRMVEGNAGVNEIHDLHDGLYLIEKTKVYVKH